MLSVLRDAVGRLEAAMEWKLVNESGKVDLKGSYVWVEQLETNPRCDAIPLIRQLIKIVANLAPQACSGYWVRRDKDEGKRIHQYTRERLTQMATRQEVRV